MRLPLLRWKKKPNLLLLWASAFCGFWALFALVTGWIVILPTRTGQLDVISRTTDAPTFWFIVRFELLVASALWLLSKLESPWLGDRGELLVWRGGLIRVPLWVGLLILFPLLIAFSWLARWIYSG